ncbi:PREDICTED: uncharacterized protein LOC109327652 [Lupinus angustifolius]|uniref:uncharacterized protein LOC109327652 n=1 Tax=Lupinus angustifolius TaxID=3871 RepID=UPI00092E7F1C|nr:PREDICTED: uncharacterized protein LOC109327652 [Lupinus angustifolius]
MDVNTAFLYGDILVSLHETPTRIEGSKSMPSLQVAEISLWIEDTSLLGAKPCSTPMDPAIKLYGKCGDQLSDPSKYKRLVGRLIYLTNIRPNIAYSVGHLSQFISTPTDVHYQVTLRIGVLTLIQGDQSLVSAFLLEDPLFLGKAKGKRLYPDPLHRLNTKLWPLLAVKQDG